MVTLRYVVFCLSVLLLVGAGQATPNPWFGTWKLSLTDPTEKPETLVYSDAGDGAMRMVSVEEGSELVTRFDGRPAIDMRTPASGNHSLAIEATSQTSYTWIFSRTRKPDVLGRNTLAPDGKSFTEVSWRSTEPDKKITLVYIRQ